jgi:16S rRNA (guanine(966)-N(2))-methyltransferase RsmD
VRETIFNVLGQLLDGERVLDLYAGTGALALEALSRGAATAVMVDDDPGAVQVCELNTAALDFGDRVRVLRMPAHRAVHQLANEREPFELIFADPPYAAKAGADILGWVGGLGLLAPEGTLLIEHDKRELIPEAGQGLTRVDLRSFGDTRVSLYRFSPVASCGE